MRPSPTPGAPASAILPGPRFTTLAGLVVALFRHVSRRRQFQFGLMLGMTLLSAAVEAISLGAVVPFIGVLTQPEVVFQNPWIAGIIPILGITTPQGLIMPLTVAFAAAGIVAGALRLILLWVSIRLAAVTGGDLCIDVYRRTLYQPYSVHVSRSSSELISGITQKVNTATVLLMSLATIVTSTVLFVTIVVALVAINPGVATIALFTFGAGYAVTAWLTRRRLIRNSTSIAREQTMVVKVLQEGLGAIRDVLLDGTQAVYSNAYARSIQKLQIDAAENTFISQAPRYAMETLGIVLVAGLAYSFSGRPDSIGDALPVLAALGLGAQRLLPLLQQVYGSWSVVMGAQAGLSDVIDLLEQPLPANAGGSEREPIEFHRTITLDQVRFQYSSGGPWILAGVNLVIPKGSRVGFVGTTGSGKSTTLDLLMSLLQPTKGRILVDGNPIDDGNRRRWQRTIAHVPQSIYLADTTIAENIAFGVPRDEIDMERVRQAAAQAQLAGFIESSAKGYDAIVGERGVRLSGGQRQRIGIARALYKQASVLVFDEATSALDGDTESAVMGAIGMLHRELTILVVAHRLTTLQHCDTIVELANGQIASQGSYEQFMKRNSVGHQLAGTIA